MSRTAGSRNSSGDDWHAGSNVGTAGAGADTKPDWRATQALGASPESVSSIKGRDPPGGGRLTDYVSSLRSGPRRSADDLTTGPTSPRSIVHLLLQQPVREASCRLHAVAPLTRFAARCNRYSTRRFPMTTVRTFVDSADSQVVIAVELLDAAVEAVVTSPDPRARASADEFLHTSAAGREPR